MAGRKLFRQGNIGLISFALPPSGVGCRMTRLAIFNCKGGVGKTTTTLNLGAAAAQTGTPVCLVDLDPQAHLSRMFGMLPSNADSSLFAHYANTISLRSLARDLPGMGILLPAHGQLMKADSLFGKGPSTLNRLKLGLDALNSEVPYQVFIDCCPFVGVLSLGAIFAADAVIIPVSSDYLSLQGAQQIVQVLKALEPVLKRRPERRFLLTRFSRRRRMCEEVRDKLAELVGDELCRTTITENVAVATSPSVGTDVFSYAPDSRGAEDYGLLFEELKQSGLL